MWPPLCRWRPPYALPRVSRVLHVWRRNPCLRVGRLLPLSESSLTSAGNEWCFGCRVVGFNIGLPYAVTDLRQAIASADRAPPRGYPPGLPDAFNRVSPRNKMDPCCLLLLDHWSLHELLKMEAAAITGCTSAASPPQLPSSYLGRFPSSSWSSHTPSWPSPPRGMAQQHSCCCRGCRPTWDACGSGAAIRRCAIVGTVQEPKCSCD